MPHASPGTPPPDLLPAYRLAEVLSGCPSEAAEEARELFLEELRLADALDADAFEAEVEQLLTALTAREETAPPHAGDGLARAPGENERLVRHFLTDLLATRHLSARRIEDLVNLARKRESMRRLTDLLNRPYPPLVPIREQLENFCRLPVGDTILEQSQLEGSRVRLLSLFVDDQLPYIGVAKGHVIIRDIHELLGRCVGRPELPGLIGGKAAGLLVASKMLRPTLVGERDEDFEKLVTWPESFYVTSNVFAEFLLENDLVDVHTHKYRPIEDIREAYPVFAKRFSEARFHAAFRDQMRHLLEQMGERPLIVRSSSHLEDNSGCSFAGKYDSYFLANQGGLSERLAALLAAIKRVYVSVYGPDPILYRRRNGLIDYDEHMAVTIQHVVGQRFGDRFFPFVSGVAFSRNPYRWTDRIRREDGFLRLVMGLGTRAVDRTEGDYARLVPLGAPTLRTETSPAQIIKYSQRLVDVLDLRTQHIESVPATTLLAECAHPQLADAISIEREGHLAPPVSQLASIEGARFCLTFDRLLRDGPFVPVMRKVLARLEAQYGAPVDIEFAFDGGKLHLLQCRRLREHSEEEAVRLPAEVPAGDLVLRFGSYFPGRRVENIEYLVLVDPKGYTGLEGQSARLARLVGALNRALEGKRYVLLGPGRWGSTNVELGVSVSYADICNALALGEVVVPGPDGGRPEISAGTHFFQDLVETGILPFNIVLGAGEDVLDLALLRGAPNALDKFVPNTDASDAGRVRVVDLAALSGGRPMEILLDGRTGRGLGYFPA